MSTKRTNGLWNLPMISFLEILLQFSLAINIKNHSFKWSAIMIFSLRLSHFFQSWYANHQFLFNHQNKNLKNLFWHSGRINIVDLAQHLRIDLTYIENKVGDVCKEDPTLQFTLGQFISAYVFLWQNKINNIEDILYFVPISVTIQIV